MTNPTNRTRAQWLADLAASEDEADAGVTVPLAPALEGAYSHPMDGTRKNAPAGWLEILAESDAEIDAGRIVSSEAVRTLFDDTLARIDAKKAAAPRRKASSQR
jgi:hypothetical protein